ncbi:DUF6286 domain-containing protein [Nocardia callitridis]|uniref:DUF6286 domain-containing protein n=1 Tax=Nocardia callitridis TaxID=648753 RepID=A0ABP9KJL7_9NOCA
MIRRPRRVVLATLVAVVLLALSVAVAVSLIQRLVGAGQFLSYDTVAGWLHGATWNQTVVLVVGAIAAAVGLVLLLVALWPGKPVVLALAPEGEVSAGVSRQGLRTALRSTAHQVDGIESARIRLRRKSIKVFARSDRTDYDGLADVVCDTLTQRVQQIGPPSIRRVRAKLSGPKTGELR